MFRHPEELILATLSVVWIIVTYFIATAFDLSVAYRLQITIATALWVGALFWLWYFNQLGYIWPIFAGLLVAAWWPLLDYLASQQAALTDAPMALMPWYGLRPWQLALAALPIVLIYLGLLVRYFRDKARGV